jgi:hypothetical protein
LLLFAIAAMPLARWSRSNRPLACNMTPIPFAVANRGMRDTTIHRLSWEARDSMRITIERALRDRSSAV